MNAGFESSRSPGRARPFSIVLLIVFSFVLAMCRPGAMFAQNPAAARIQQKAQKVQKGLRAWQRAGKNPARPFRLMQRARDQIKKKNLGEAEALVDQALAILEGRAAPARAGGTRYEKVRVIGETAKNGIYDPALAYNEDGTVGWLAYSAAGGSLMTKAEHLSTHLAKTTDGGKSWTYVKTINQNQPGTVTLPDGKQLKGFWHYEVSTLVHDPGDPGKEWKLFAHKYFWSKTRMPAFGWIIYKHAADPAGKWSDEVALFGAGKFPPAPYDFQKYRLDKLHRELRNYVAFSEPGALVKDGVLYLSMSALKKDGSDKIVLLASADHGKTWKYVGALADRKDARALGAKALDGSSLFEYGGRVYLLATPIRSESRPDIVDNGTFVFEVADIRTASLKRDGEGKPILLKHIEPMNLDSGNHGAGQAAYHRYNTYGGIMFPQVNLSAVPEFAQIFNTRIRLPLDGSAGGSSGPPAPRGASSP